MEEESSGEETENRRQGRNAIAPPEVYSTVHTNPTERMINKSSEEKNEKMREKGDDALVPPVLSAMSHVEHGEQKEDVIDEEGSGIVYREKRNGINPSYIPPTFGIGPGEEAEQVEGSGEARDQKMKRNGLNPAYIPPTFGIGPAEDPATDDGSNHEEGERLKRQIDELEHEFGGRGPITPPPYFPEEKELPLPTAAAALEEIDDIEGSGSEQKPETKEMRRRKRCSICNEPNERVGDEGIVESGANENRESSTTGPFDSGTNKGQNYNNEELYERMRRHNQGGKHRNKNCIILQTADMNTISGHRFKEAERENAKSSASQQGHKSQPEN